MKWLLTYLPSMVMFFGMLDASAWYQYFSQIDGDLRQIYLMTGTVFGITSVFMKRIPVNVVRKLVLLVIPISALGPIPVMYGSTPEVATLMLIMTSAVAIELCRQYRSTIMEDYKNDLNLREQASMANASGAVAVVLATIIVTTLDIDYMALIAFSHAAVIIASSMILLVKPMKKGV